MAKMYPNNLSVEIFGEQVEWPGMGPDGKFSNGSFTDPGVKPSFIPGDTLNLILDNLSSLIEKCGGTPNATGQGQLAELATHLAQAHRLIQRDASGRAKVSAPADEDDIARLKEIVDAGKLITPAGYGLYGAGRSLYDVLKINTLQGVIEALHERTIAGEYGDYNGLQLGDYIDGIDLTGGSINVPWNDTYKNNRVVISGFNHFKGAGETENTENHILFTFANCPMTRRMNANDTNTGGYAATEMRTFLEGDFKAALQAVFGDHLYPVNRLLSTKGNWAWRTDTVFLPTGFEIWGTGVWDEPNFGGGFQAQFPLYRDSVVHKIKRYNGSRQRWWLASPSGYDIVSFVNSSYYGNSSYYTASAICGVAPAFCVA
jgi:hypothetical protein